MFENIFSLTGVIRFQDLKVTANDNKILNAVLSRGNKEKGYENYKIRAYKNNALELNHVQSGTIITITGWLSQDNWERDGEKYSNVILNVKEWAEYRDE